MNCHSYNGEEHSYESEEHSYNSDGHFHKTDVTCIKVIVNFTKVILTDINGTPSHNESESHTHFDRHSYNSQITLTRVILRYESEWYLYESDLHVTFINVQN